MLNRDDFLKAVTVKQKTIKLETLDNKEIVIKEHTINESQELEKLRIKVLKQESKEIDLIIQACKYSIVEPKLSDEEYTNLNQKAYEILTEVYMKIPTIGMTEQQEKDYEKHLIESMNNEVKKILSKEEEEKK